MKDKGHPTRRKEPPDIREIEEQALDVLKVTEDLDIGQEDIPEEVQNKLKGLKDYDWEKIEKELNIGDVDSIPGLQGTLNEGSAGKDSTQSRETKSTLEPVDGEFKIHLAEDKMSATIDLVPSNETGKAVSLEEIKKKLSSMDIVHGIEMGVIEKAVEAVEKTQKVEKGINIAQGVPHKEGRDGKIEYFFKDTDNIFKNGE